MPLMRHSFTSILITGASSGLGAALAEHYAAPEVRLALLGRDRARLNTVAARCRSQGAQVETGIVDVADRAALARWIEAADDRAPLDLVIANAGISGANTGLPRGDKATQADERGHLVLQVNIGGVINTIGPASVRMRRRKRGTLAVVSSLASFRGMPGSPAYSASKAAIRIWAEAVRPILRAEGVTISTICPGFIDTPMTARNGFRMPFLMSAEQAAVKIGEGLARGRARIAFPFPMYFAAWLLAALPPGLVDHLLAALPRKPE